MTIPPTHVRTALVVDDDKPILQLLQDILEEANFDTTAFTFGQPALEAIAQRHFDLLVIDVGLPDMNGMRISEEARRRYGNDAVILIITADSRTERLITAFELGADDFVSKPFNIEELLMRINVKLRRIDEDEA